MCGIAGAVGGDAPELLPRMLGALVHRGPDDVGTHGEPGVALGITRLAIIDLTGGHQPMSTEDGSLWIVFNGEIYNYRELRAELEANGRRFTTRSDTEVILHLFAEVGERAVDRLRGMFALAVWDARRRQLVLARDRLGKKPLYYWHRDGLFLFASEIKALLCHPAVSRAPALDVFQHYLAFGYTPGDRSIFAEISKLPPAHTATLRGDTLAIRQYWTLPAASGVDRPASAEEGAERVRRAVHEAVRLRLESDVPLGILLSGGIDSSAVVASVREVTSGRIATFSIGFGRAAAPYDELPYARVVARQFETEHHEEILAPDVAGVLPDIVRHFDEPFADSSAIPTFALARATARHVKVALSGIGGDEAFAGYPRYLGVRLAETYGAMPYWLRTLPRTVIGRVVRDSAGSPDWGSRVRRFVTGAERPLPDRYLEWTRFFGEADVRQLASPALQDCWTRPVDATHRAAFASRGDGDAVDGAFRIDLATYLPDDLLVMADRMSMAHSLELRAPFCDHRLIEASLGIPSVMKLPGLRLKGLLKMAFADVLPRAVLAREKQGLMIPLGRWLRTELRSLVEELLAPERVRARGLFVPDAVATLRREHAARAADHGDRLWTLMMAELWMREYLDGGDMWRLTP